MTDQGADVFDTGLASTPAMFMTTVTDGYLYDRAVHDYSAPAHEQNGIKIFCKGRRAGEKSDFRGIGDCRKEGLRQDRHGKLQKIPTL